MHFSVLQVDLITRDCHVRPPPKKMAEGSLYDGDEKETSERILRRELNSDQFNRFRSILDDYHQARITGTYRSSDSDRYSQRFLEVIGERHDLRDTMMKLPGFEPVPDVSIPPTQTPASSEELYEKFFLEGLEQELDPHRLRRVLSVLNEVKCVAAAGAGRLDAQASKIFFWRFEEVIGDHLDILTRAMIYLGSHRNAENIEIPTPERLRNMFFTAKFTLILLRDIRNELNDVKFSVCLSIWERYQEYGIDSMHLKVESKNTFERFEKVLRPHERLMRKILEVPWPHLNESLIERQTSPSPDQNILVPEE